MFHVDLTAKDIMTAPVITVRDSMAIEEVADLFSNKMISGAPVLDDNSRIVGVVSLSDIVRNEPRREHIVSDKVGSDYVLRDFQNQFDTEDLTSGYHLEESETLLVRDIMTPFIYRVNEDTPLREIADIMTSGRIHRLFVTRDETVVGVVSVLDMLKLLITRA